MKISRLLSDKSKWTQKAYARDNKGGLVSPVSPNAVAWDLAGATFKLYPVNRAYIDAQIVSFLKLKKQSVVGWNDSVTFEKVKEVVKELDI